MKELFPSHMSGYLLDTKTKHSDQDLVLSLFKGIKFVSTLSASKWNYYTFTSTNPLLDELREDPNQRFIYPIICRVSGTRMLLLSRNKKIIDILLTHNEISHGEKIIQKVPVEVDQFIRTLVSSPIHFNITFANGHVPAFGSALKYASFYGFDLGDAEIFRDNIKFMTINTCGIKRIEDSSEILKIGNDGMISFFLPSAKRLDEVLEIIKYLSNKKYLNYPDL